MNIVSSITSSIVSSIIAKSSAIAAWFKLLTTDPANSTPTKGATVFSRATGGKAFDSNGLLVSYAPNVPRQQDGGLLIEEYSTNICRYSQDFTNAVWIKRGAASVTANTHVAIDGNTTADTLSVAAMGTGDIFQVSSGFTAGAKVSPSIFIQRISTTGILVIGDPAHGTGKWEINLALLGNGINRIKESHAAVTVVIAFAATAGSNGLHFYEKNGATISFAAWGAQVEAGSKATSYIKTFGAPVTRDADVCYTATANIPTLANGATFVWRGALPNDGATHTAIETSPNYVIVRRALNGNIEAYAGNLFLGGVGGIDTAIHTFSLRTNGINLHELLIDGVVVKTSIATGLLQPTAPLYIGSWGGNTVFLNGSIQSFAMYDIALTDAEIQRL